jgi:CheY-like chemotaxis protein
VIGKRVTDLLDLHAVIAAVDEHWFDKNETDHASGATVLVADPSSFVRGLVRNSLEMAGYRVVEAAGTRAALRELEQGGIDAVVTGLDLPVDGGNTLIEAMRRVPALSDIPALGLTDSPAQHPDGFSDCQMKFDRSGMLRSLARLASAVATAEPVVPATEKG